MSLVRKLRALFRKEKLDAEMSEEMQHHLDAQVQRNLASGMSPEDARYAALRAFGGVEQVKEIARDQRGWVGFEQLRQDVRHGLRSLLKTPGFTGVAILSLAVGIGAGTAVFSVVNAILLRSLPVPNPHELRVLHWSGSKQRIGSINGGDTAFTPPHFFRLREQAAGKADLFGFVPLTDLIARVQGESFPAQGLMVSDNFFSGLEVQPLIGRALAAGDDYVGAGTTAVISYNWWEKHFALDPAVIGQPLVINGTAFTIVGVLPRGFSGPQAGQPGEFYVPMAPQSRFLYRPLDSTFHWYVRIMARLRPADAAHGRAGTDDLQLKAALDVAWATAAAEFMQEPRITIEAGRGGETNDRANYRKPLLLLLGVVGVVMLVACANLAGLSLARGAARQHEMAVRAALGAGRWRLIRQSLTESFVLALLGGSLGVFIAGWLRTGIAQLLTGARGELHYDFSVDFRVLGFTLVLALLTALLAGLFPALRASRIDAVDGLKSRGSLLAPRLRAGRVLVTAQIGLSLLLLAGAGLYLRTLVNLSRIDAGFPTEKLLLFRLNISGSAYATAQPAEYYARVQETLANLPGAKAASFLEFPLLSNQSSNGGFNSFSRRAATAGTSMQTRRLSVGETFFATMGIPVVSGRGLTAADDERAPKVIIVNEAFVRQYLPDENPLGLTIPVWDADWQIVGVSRDVSYNTVKGRVPPTAYFPFRQRFYSRFKQSHLRAPYFAVRSALPPLTLMPAVRLALQAIDPDVAVTDITTQDDVRASGIGQERLFALLCSALAGLALVLACIGLYGLMAYNVARRTSEIGLRMALGATRHDIAWPIVREALLLAAAGLAIGLPAALGLVGLVRNQLYGVSAVDPLSLAAGAILLLGVAAVAAWMPARRAANVDPLIALRTE